MDRTGTGWSRRSLTCSAGVIGIALALTASPSAAGEWPWTRWRVWCRDPPDCAPADAVYGPLLEHASRWLDGLDFGPPRVLYTGSPEMRYHSATVSDRTNREHESVGVYYPLEKRLFLKSDAYFTLGEPGQTHDDPEYQVELSYEFTPVHELFHAVQAGYQEGLAEERPGWYVERRWIVEGTATSVQTAYSKQFEPELQTKKYVRLFDSPLHEPASKSASYGTWLFWNRVGKQIASPSRVQYLRDVLSEDLTQNRGLDGVDRALKDHGGLYSQLPLFFSGLDIDEGYFGAPPAHRATLPSGEREARHLYPDKVRKVAGDAAKVSVSHSSTNPVEVEISFVSDDPDLHLIVDGALYDHDALRTRNRYTEVLLGRPTASYDVTVANVAREPGVSRDRDYVLQVELRAASCSFSATVAGDTDRKDVDGAMAHFSTRGQVGLMGGMGGRMTAEAKEDLLNAMKMAQGLQGLVGGAAGVSQEVQDQLVERLQGEIDEEREARGSSGSTLGLSLVESGDGHLGPDPAGGQATAFKLDAFSEQGIEPGFTGEVPLDRLAFHTGEFASEGLAPTLYRWDRETEGSASLTVKQYDGQWMEGTVTADLPAITGILKLDGGKPWVRVSADFVAGLFNPMRMENACMMAAAFGE